MAWYPGKNIIKLGKKAFDGVKDLTEGAYNKLKPKDGAGQVTTEDLMGDQAAIDAVYGSSQSLADAAFGQPFQDRASQVADRGIEGLAQATQAYQDVLSGKGKSLAQMATFDAAEQARQAGQAIASSGRGNNALALRAAANNSQQQMQNASRQAGMIGLQEQEAARRGLSQLGAQQFQAGEQSRLSNADRVLAQRQDERNAGLNFATGNQQFGNQRRQQDLDLAGGLLQSGGGIAAAFASDRNVKSGVQDGKALAKKMIDDVTIGPAQIETPSLANQAIDVQMGPAQIEPRFDVTTGQAEILPNIQIGQAQIEEPRRVFAGPPAPPGLAAASDVNVKSDVASGSGDVKPFLDNLEAKSYNYIDPKFQQHAEPRHLGVMAQDLEKSELGSRYVSEDAEGVKRVDYGAMQPAVLASLAMLNDEVEELKRKK